MSLMVVSGQEAIQQLLPSAAEGLSPLAETMMNHAVLVPN